MSEAGEEEHIPIGDTGAFIDTSQAVIGMWTAAENSDVADVCFNECNPNGVVEYYGSESVARFCMMNAMQGGGKQEMITEVEIHCKGPRRKLLVGPKVCGASVKTHEVPTPHIDASELDTQ